MPRSEKSCVMLFSVPNTHTAAHTPSPHMSPQHLFLSQPQPATLTLVSTTPYSRARGGSVLYEEQETAAFSAFSSHACAATIAAGLGGGGDSGCEAGKQYWQHCSPIGRPPESSLSGGIGNARRLAQSNLVPPKSSSKWPSVHGPVGPSTGPAAQSRGG